MKKLITLSKLYTLTLLFLPIFSNAQTISTYTFGNSVTTYTALSGATIFTINGGGGTLDDGGSAVQTIPFTFTFGGNNFTQYTVCTNGFIAFGNSLLSSTSYSFSYNAYTGALNNVLCFTNRDLNNTGAVYSNKTDGVSPNRIHKIQCAGFYQYNTTTQSGNCQIWLYETTNKIEIRYGAYSTTWTLTCKVGLRGPTNTTNDFRSLSGAGATAWSSPTYAFNTLATMNQANPVNADNGRMYTFTPPAATPMSYVSSTTTQSLTSSVSKNTTNNQIIGIQIVTSGNLTPFNVTSLNLNTNGSTNPPTDITNGKVWYTGTSSTFATTTQFGSTFAGPNGPFTVNGSQALQTGTNYFWVTYDIPATATTGDFVDAECNQIVMDGVGGTRTPTVQAPAGSRQILCNNQVGSGVVASAVPFNTFWHDSKMDALYLGSEISAGGCGTCGNISTVGFNVSSVSAQIMNGFNIKMQNTSLTTLTGFTNTGWTTVYSSSYTVPGTGWQYITLTTPFPWDGTSGILIEICFDNTSFTSASNVYATTTVGNLTAYQSTDNAAGCSFAAPTLTTTRPNIQFSIGAGTSMSYSSSTSTQTVTTPVSLGSTNNQIIGIQVVTNGACSPINATNFDLNTNGTTNATDITNGKLFYTGTSSTFATTTQFGSTFANPNGSFSITGTQSLQNGTNYFWLAYDISGSATNGDVVDAECTSVTVNSTQQTPTVTAPAGSRTIAAPLFGSYTVGVSAFNSATGHSLYAQKLTRTVKTLEVVINNKMSDKDVLKTPETSIGVNSNNVSYREVEKEEEYYELYEYGKKYSGPLKIKSDGNDAMTGVYATITAALSDLNNLGVSSAVTFLLTDSNYPSETYPLQFNSSISGVSSSNPVIMKPNTGVTSIIPGNIASNATIRVLNNYVIIDGSNSGGTDRSLTIQNNNATAPNVVLFGSTGTTPITNVTLKNCIITTTVQVSSNIVISDATTIGNPGYFNTVTIQNNDIRSAYIGVYATGGTSPQNGLNLFLYNNILTSTGTSAILGTALYMQGVNGATVSGNDVSNMINSTAASNYRVGLWLATGTINATVEKNKFHDLQYTGTGGWPADGMKISTGVTGANVIIKNNMIYNITGDGDSYASFAGTYEPIGIWCFSTQTGINIYNNSIFLYGNTINLSGAYSICIDLDAGTTADIRNNVLVNNLGLLAATGSGALCLATQTSSAQLSQNNYNLFYANPSTGIKGLVKMGSAGVDQTTMTGVRTATGKDQQSFNKMPSFISTTDLHIQTSDLTVSGRGAYIASVSNDYDGNTRATTQSMTDRPVDVGCDQYTPTSYTGNSTALSGAIYQDGAANVLEIVSGSITTSGVFNFPGVRTPNNTGNPPMSVNVPWLYYNINDFVVTSNPVTMRFYYNDEQLATISEANLKVAVWDGANWELNFIETVNTTNNYVEMMFDDWLGTFPTPLLFALTDGGNALPVNISEFKALTHSRDVSISWITTQEINNSGFRLERRTKENNGNLTSNWAELVFIPGHGTTNEQHSYSYTDRKLNSGKYEYRLKQIDINGNFEYYALTNPNVVEVGKPVSFGISQNYPNPSNPKSRIDYQLPADGKVSIVVYDELGREVAQLLNNETKEAGYYTIEFDGTNISSGVYFYRIIAQSNTGERNVKTMKMLLIK